MRTIDVTNGQTYLSINPVSQTIAIAIMNIPLIVNCIGNTSKQIIASIYSPTEYQIFLLMDIVGYNYRTPKKYPENHGVSKGYLWHYHSISEGVGRDGSVHNPHAFFGF